jgi:hypothetical protein
MSDEQPTPGRYPLGEPSVLDYVKSLFRVGDGERIHLPRTEEHPVEDVVELSEENPSAGLQPLPPLREQAPLVPFPWFSLLALGLALVAQRSFEPPRTAAELGFGLYIIAFALLGWALHRGEWTLAPFAPTWLDRTDPLTYRGFPLLLSVALGFLSVWLFGNHIFTLLNVTVWFLAVASLVGAFWLTGRERRSRLGNVRASLQREVWTFSISRWGVVLLAATALVFFFRFYQTASVPPEPFSDHAEKILDVYDVSQGQTKVFFPRNTGRESFQMYWTLLVASVFGTGLSFLSLKLGTAVLGFLTLPFIYLLGKEIGGSRVGLFAFLLVGIGYWPNVISRVGLRFPLYPLFAAPVLLYLLRGLRTRNRNDFLLAGLFLGVGLHGYSPMRIVPFVVIAAFVLYWLHLRQSWGARKDLPVWLVMAGLVAMFVFIPLLRFWLDNPAAFGFRAFTRLGSVEQPLPGPAYQIFFSNLWNALAMFNYDNGVIWVHSIPERPALDVVSAALFLIGVVLVLVRYIRQRHWLDLFLLVSIPLLQMPSILSLAFPDENPALNRAGAAYIPAFLLAALALDGLLTGFGRGGRRGLVKWGVAAFLLLLSVTQNYHLVFNQYYNSFRSGSWNSSDMGRVIREFEQTYGRTDNVWIVPFPHWVDTRLPAVWAGIPNRDLALWREDLEDTLESTGARLFLVKANLDEPEGNDLETLDVLEELYPNGRLRLFESDVPGHDFWIFTVPEN